MKAYRIRLIGEYEDPKTHEFATNYNDAVILFNNLIRKTLKELTYNILRKDQLDEDDYKYIYENSDREMISKCRKFCIYKDNENNSLNAVIFYEVIEGYYEPEYSTYVQEITLEEIKIKENIKSV